MSLQTTCYVLVAKIVTEIVEVSAVTLEEAKEKADRFSGVTTIIDASYDKSELKKHPGSD